MKDTCDKCSSAIEPDGFCSWHGQLFDMWLCDDCVHQLRGGGSILGVVRPTATLDQIEHALIVLDGAIRNLGMIDLMTGRDGAMQNRDVDLYLNFRESRPVYELLVNILNSKLDAAKDVAAENARALLKRLDK